MRSCPECGSDSLSWESTLDVYPNAPFGRLTPFDMRAVYVRGCGECSATVETVLADDPAVLRLLDQLDTRTAHPIAAPEPQIEQAARREAERIYSGTGTRADAVLRQVFVDGALYGAAVAVATDTKPGDHGA